MGTSDRLGKVTQIFAAALELSPPERTDYLARACGGDDELRAEVESLLEHDARAGDGFLRPPTVDLHTTPDVPAWVQRLLGRKIGNYTLLRLLGYGGMGCVFEAQQEHPRRIVALKVLRPGFSAPSALARFRLEPEMLGRLRHPNIAQVFEAGVHTPVASDEDAAPEPLPYFALEYIEGARPLIEYADTHDLTTRQRLELFAKVCDAVHHGHQKGIIHRDIKPGNILVGVDGEPKVIDFGVARASDADILLTTQCTRVGELVGTVQYMSPEQCDGQFAEIDTRSDIYSLGVVLYELLTGARPYDTHDATIYGAIRIIKEHAPRPPSAAVSVDQRPTRTPGRARTARELRGDLDTIVLKALEKDRDKRYASAAELAADIRRYLNNEPISARPPTRWMRTTRWMQRHPYLTTLSLCLLLAASVVAATFVLVWYTNERPYRIVLEKDPGTQYERSARAARLVTLSRRELKSWGGTADSVAFAELVDRPPALGGGRLALVAAAGVKRGHPLAFLGAYDTRRSLDEPEWIGEILPGEPVPDPHNRGYKGREFYCHFAAVLDVFPEHPGQEVVTCYQVHPYSQSIIRILDLKGERLYEIWHDGGVHGCYYMGEPKLLVFCGLNSEVADWQERGYPAFQGAQDARVLFAIRPRYRDPQLCFLGTQPGDGPAQPAFYKCLWPPELVGQVGTELAFVGLEAAWHADPARAAAVVIRLGKTAGRIVFEIDEHGHEIPGTRVITDEYKQERKPAPGRGVNPPDPDLISLHDLPPVLHSPTTALPSSQPQSDGIPQPQSTP